MPPTSLEELERVHLRFIRVTDDIKLTEILQKILPNILRIFFEPDLSNANLDNLKIKGIEQIIGHLMMRVKNSPIVNPPWSAIIDIFNDPLYTTEFQNENVKMHATERIFQFLFESFSRIPAEQDQAVLHVLLQAMANDDLKYQVKCRLFLFLVHKIAQYAKVTLFAKLGEMLQPIMTEDLKMSFLQMSLYYLVTNFASQATQNSIRQTFQQAIVEMTGKFKTDLKETQTQFIQNYEDTILKFVSIQTLFTAEEILPLFVIASLSNINKTRDTGEVTVRGLLGTIDTRGTAVPTMLFKIAFTELYIYKDFSEREDQEIQQLAPQMQSKVIEYIIKFESSASLSPYNQKLIYHCFNSVLAQNLQKVGLQFIKHMIRFNDLKNDSAAVAFLRSTLLGILKPDSVFDEEAKSTALLHLGDMAMQNYEAVNDDIDLAINTFDRLKERITQLEGEGHFAIRNDSIANNYIETLNRLRDCYEEKLHDANKRSLIVGYVLNSLNKENTTTTNQEIIYLLFLYLVRLDSGQFNSSVLLQSIILKDHVDIKIKKEAQRQIDTFNQQMLEAEKSDGNTQTSSTRCILRPFLKDISVFLHRNHMNYIYDGSEYQLAELLTFGSMSGYKQDFIDKVLEISQFVLRFYKDELRNKETLMDLGDLIEVQEKIERLLMMNLNQNFQVIKHDFSQPLNLIQEYLHVSGGSVGAIEIIGINFIYKLGQGTANLAQRVLSLKIINKILRTAHSADSKQHIQDFFMQLINFLPQPDAKLELMTHEVRLTTLYNLTILSLFQEQIAPEVLVISNKMLYSLINILTHQKSALSPNIFEQLKFLSSCLRKLGQKFDLQLSLFLNVDGNSSFVPVLDFYISHIKRSELDPVYRKFIILNMAGILKKTSPEIQISKIDELIAALIDIDNADIQETLGKTLAKVNYYAKRLPKFSTGLMAKVFAKEGVSLNIKRNSGIYLFEVVDIYGKTQQSIQSMFLDIQKVFLKFLFDRKSYMQDLSSKALSHIYHQGTPEVRTLLVDALSKTFSGEKLATEHHEKDENQELLLEFKDNTSTEQREKMKTYKDLVNIAQELGHQELIYQFLEVHRHMSHYQDVKNAAKGLSKIIMLDERLRADLLKIAPKILLLSYDHSNEVKETMKELWGSLIEMEKEEQIINNRWEEIFKEAFGGLTSKEYRRRQSSCLALSDLLNNRSWLQIKGKFRELFLTTLGLLDDSKDSVKIASYQLLKTLKRITLKFGNIYTNGNVAELEEVLSIVIPMILDDCMKSQMEQIKFFSVDLLFDIVKTAQSQSGMLKQMKMPNHKQERQLVFNYNSEQKMKEIMNKHLTRIVVEVLANLSTMNKAVEIINQWEQYAIGAGLSSSSHKKSTPGISESELNDMRVKYTKESSWGEILKICRELMTQETFNSILNDLLNFMLKGHDQITKSSAIAFVDDIILENKLYLITPQNSRKIATKQVEIYSLNSAQAGLSIKESIQGLYAQCLGLQMKILREYPKTVASLIEMIIKLPKELNIIICLNIYEITKNLPESMLKSDASMLKEAIPIIFVNSYQLNDHRLKTLCKKAFTYLSEYIPHLIESNQEEIFKVILVQLESSSYDDRVAASQAMQEVCLKLSDEDVQGSQIVQMVIDKMHSLIQGKYFNNKEQVLEGFMSLAKMANLAQNREFVTIFLGDTCLKQIEKYLTSKLTYKNQVLKSVLQILEVSKQVVPEVKQALFELLQRDLRANLQKISEKASMIENQDEFEEKHDEEKQTMHSALQVFECLPYLIPDPNADQGQYQIITEVSLQYYQRSNWLVRNGTLKCFIKLLKLKKINDHIIQFVDQLIKIVAETGEKFDTNLALISEVILLFCEGPFKNICAEDQERIRLNISKVLEICVSRATESVMKNVDIIKNYIGLM